MRSYCRRTTLTLLLTQKVIPITFSSRIRELMNKRMRLAVVVKLLGCSIGYRTLYDKLVNLWKPQESFKLIDLVGDCYIVKFKSEYDYLAAQLDGPWVIFCHYLTVHPWQPSFSPMNLEINKVYKVYGWIRLPNLPVKYYHKSLLRAIAQVLGEVVRIDYNTEAGGRGQFARLAVIIDLTKPLTSKLKVDGEELIVEYEGLPTICYHCGRYSARGMPTSY